MDYRRLKIPCLKTTWNINCGKFKNPISISKHENISGDETGFTVTKRSRAKNIPSMLLFLVFIINKHGQPLCHMHETWLICIKQLYIFDMYLMHNGCDIANQMLSNGQLWIWHLIFKICITRLLSLVVYIWSYLWFSFQVCSTKGVYYFTKWTAWGLAPNGRQQDPGNWTEAAMKFLKHL